MSNLQKNAAEILSDEHKLKDFAALNRLAIDSARIILERLSKEPELSAEFKDYVFSNERSEDLRGFVAGEEKGYQRGHEAGFAKGAALGIIGTLTIAGLAMLQKLRQP